MNRTIFSLCLAMVFIMCSCIKEEALNSEAAIDSCTGKDVIHKLDIDYKSNPKAIKLFTKKGADLSHQELNFILSDGASINLNTPTSKEENQKLNIYDFDNETNSLMFTVTSEDGRFKPQYRISIEPTVELPDKFSFENLKDESDDRDYDIISINKKKSLDWTSGNGGYELTLQTTEHSQYPTTQIENGYIGKGAKLETCSTGTFGQTVNMPIAAGNLFIGNFNLKNATSKPKEATKFGVPFYKTPLFFRGYYKYKPGKEYKENDKIVSGKVDCCDMYAVLYEADNFQDMLDGTNSLTSSKIVALARVNQEDIVKVEANADISEATWQTFNCKFNYLNNKSIDKKKLEEGKYKLSIVLSSSINGADFNGAVGSTLYVDELELVCEE